MTSTTLTHQQELLTLCLVARHECVHPGTVYRWATRGIRSRRGALVVLETWRRGGRVVTSVEALERFHRALNDAAARSDATLGCGDKISAALDDFML